MNLETKLQLLGLFKGELSLEQARELEARLEREPDLAAATVRLRAAWDGLELPPAAPVPLGYAGRVMARVRSEAARGREPWSLATAPTWVRRTAAAALFAGLAIGAGVGLGLPAEDAAPRGTISLAESYRAMVDEAPPAAPAAPLPPPPQTVQPETRQ